MIKLDPLDLKILAALQREGRMSKVNLAKMVNLSVSACWERLRKLEREGVICGYHAEIKLEKLLKTTMIWVEVSLNHHHREDFETFETGIREIPEIVECWATGGAIDYLMRVVSPDLGAYQNLMEKLLVADIGINRYVTCVVTKMVKRSRVLPLKALMTENISAKRG